MSINWQITNGDPPGRFRLCWQESGGPLVEEPRRKGFGSVLLRRVLADDVNAHVTIDFQPAGLFCTIEATLPAEPQANGNRPTLSPTQA